MQLLSSVTNFSRSLLLPYIVLRGPTSPEMTDRVDFLLNKIPKRASTLAVVISSPGGSFAQANIIADKIKNKTKQNNIELITFAEEFALNSAFLLLMAGDRVFADKTTIIGGLEMGESKINMGIFSEYISNITYQDGESMEAEINKEGAFSTTKAEDMKNLFENFSQQAKEKVHQIRKLKQETDLFKLYNGQEALEKGIIDGFGRIHERIPHLHPNSNLKLITQSKLDQIKAALKRYKFNS